MCNSENISIHCEHCKRAYCVDCEYIDKKMIWRKCGKCMKINFCNLCIAIDLPKLSDITKFGICKDCISAFKDEEL